MKQYEDGFFCEKCEEIYARPVLRLKLRVSYSWILLAKAKIIFSFNSSLT